MKPDPRVLVNLGYRVHAENTDGVVVAPTPTAGGDVITGWLVQRPALLVSDTDTSPFDREWDRAIRYRVMQLGAEWDRQDVTEVQMWEAKYEGEVAKARRSRNRFATKGSRGLRPSSGLVESPSFYVDYS